MGVAHARVSARAAVWVVVAAPTGGCTESALEEPKAGIPPTQPAAPRTVTGFDPPAAYPIAAGELFAVRQDRSRVGGRRAPRGVAVFHPRSGDLVAFLDLGTQIGWTGPLVWLDARTLLMHDGKSGRLRLWDVLAARLSPVTRVANHGVYVEAAVDALRDAAN